MKLGTIKQEGFSDVIKGKFNVKIKTSVTRADHDYPGDFEFYDVDFEFYDVFIDDHEVEVDENLENILYEEVIGV